MTEPVRCWGPPDELLTRYHDEEWGRPALDERTLFERVCLEGFQAGLSWIVVLRKREALRELFAGFDPDALVGFTSRDLERVLADPRGVRNRRKAEAVVSNARALLELRSGEGLTALVERHRPAPRAAPRGHGDVPATSPESVALAADLRRAGFRFIGPTTAYALLQACGLVNDHLAGCWVRADVEAARRPARAGADTPAPARGGRRRRPTLAP